MTEATIAAGTENTDAASTTAAATPTGEGAATQQTGAAQAEGTASAAAGAPASSQTAANGAPEAYADFRLPEGIALGELDGEVKGLAKELNLSQEAAQKVVDTAAKLAQQGVQQQAQTVQSIHDSWRADAMADKEFGGEKLAENLARAKASMEATSTPQLQVLLDKTGLGNHPEVIRHFLRIAPAYLTDTHVPGGKAPQGVKSAEKVLYPNNA